MRTSSSTDYDPLHVRIVNHPVRPAPSARLRARRGRRRDRSRAVCVSVIVSAAASKPSVCVPGIAPARVDDDIDVRGVARPPAAALDRERGSGWRIALGRVMQLVDPGAELGCGAQSARRHVDDGQEHVHAEGEIRRGDHAELRDAARARRPASLACQPVVPMTTGSRRGAGARTLRARPRQPRSRRQRRHRASRPSVLLADDDRQQQIRTRLPAARRAGPCGRVRRAARGAGVAFMRWRPSACPMRRTKPRAVDASLRRGWLRPARSSRSAATEDCETMRSGKPFQRTDHSNGCARVLAAGRRRRRTESPSPRSTFTSPNSESSAAISPTRRSSSTVTDTLTSDVVTTSTAVRCRSNTSNTRRRNPCAISIRVDVISITVMPRLQAIAASGSSRRDGSADDQRAGAVRFAAIENPNRDVAVDRGQDRARVQDLGAEIRQLRRFAERQLRSRARIRDDTRDRR